MLIPKFSAAFVLFPFTSSKVWVISSFSISCIVPLNLAKGGAFLSICTSSSSKNKCEGSNVFSWHMRTDRSIIFSSSRILPGQVYFFSNCYREKKN